MWKFYTLLAVTLLLARPPGAQATFSLDVGNGTASNPGINQNTTVSSPYANLDITGNTTTGVLTFTLTNAGTNSAKFGEFGFNLNGISASDFTVAVTGTGGTASTWSNQGSGQMDGFGNFAVIVGPSSNAAANRLDSVTITLQFAAGKFSEATLASVESLNSGAGNPPGAFYFSAEYFPTSGTYTGFIGTATLPDTNPGGHPVPAPPSVVLFGVGGLCLAGCMFRSRRRMAAAA